MPAWMSHQVRSDCALSVGEQRWNRQVLPSATHRRLVPKHAAVPRVSAPQSSTWGNCLSANASPASDSSLPVRKHMRRAWSCERLRRRNISNSRGRARATDPRQRSTQGNVQDFSVAARHADRARGSCTSALELAPPTEVKASPRSGRTRPDSCRTRDLGSRPGGNRVAPS